MNSLVCVAEPSLKKIKDKSVADQIRTWDILITGHSLTSAFLKKSQTERCEPLSLQISDEEHLINLNQSVISQAVIVQFPCSNL